MLSHEPGSRFTSEDIFKSQWVTLMAKHYDTNVTELGKANEEYVQDSI